MKYIGTQNGKISLFEKEAPEVKKNFVLIKTIYSAISPGTEITINGKSKENVIGLGYSAAGKVLAVGEGVEGIDAGDYVATYGAPYTGHAEILSAPKTLCVKIPEGVDLKGAAIAGIGSIAIHALRQADLKFGEICVVVGLGIYGQLISQIAHNSGLVVLPLNRSAGRAKLLEGVSGIKTYTDEEELEKAITEASGGRGADAVLLCAGGDSGYLTNKSLEWVRDKGKSIIVGDIQPIYDRGLMFKKEVELLISRAGGPGRYDRSYELNAVDYPYGLVRWTEGRNIAEFIRLLKEQRISINKYVEGISGINESAQAYEELSKKDSPYLTYLFHYQED